MHKLIILLFAFCITFFLFFTSVIVHETTHWIEIKNDGVATPHTIYFFSEYCEGAIACLISSWATNDTTKQEFYRSKSMTEARENHALFYQIIYVIIGGFFLGIFLQFQQSRETR